MTDIPTTDWQQFARSSAGMDVHLLGKVDFASCLQLQERLVDELLVSGEQHAKLLICEHPPTISIGRQGSAADLLADPEELRAWQMPVYQVSRAGGCWVHAPGQLAVYPILPLESREWSPLAYRERLEAALLAFSKTLGIAATTSLEVPGLLGRCGQFAFIGSSIRLGVSHHGLFVNVAPPPHALRLADWRGADHRISSVSAHRLRPISMGHVREALIRHLTEELGYPRYSLFTGHPTLRRTVRKVYDFHEPAAHPTRRLA